MKPAEHVRVNITDDGIVILDIDKGELYSANRTAAKIWTGLMSGSMVPEIMSEIKEEFPDADLEEIGRDLLMFVESLVKKNLIEDVKSANFGSGEWSEKLNTQLKLIGSSSNIVT